MVGYRFSQMLGLVRAFRCHRLRSLGGFMAMVIRLQIPSMGMGGFDMGAVMVMLEMGMEKEEWGQGEERIDEGQAEEARLQGSIHALV
jgi:hypothetical protein